MYKQNLAYVAEDYGLDYEDFVKYCFANYPHSVWQVFDGMKYCFDDSADFLAEEYLEFKQIVKEYSYEF
jgi:hypothetical protein